MRITGSWEGIGIIEIEVPGGLLVVIIGNIGMQALQTIIHNGNSDSLTHNTLLPEGGRIHRYVLGLLLEMPLIGIEGIADDKAASLVSSLPDLSLLQFDLLGGADVGISRTCIGLLEEIEVMEGADFAHIPESMFLGQFVGIGAIMHLHDPFIRHLICPLRDLLVEGLVGCSNCGDMEGG